MLADACGAIALALGCLGAAAAAAALAAKSTASPLILCAASFFFGVSALPVYSLCVAQANDFGAEDFVEVSGGLLLLFGVGAMAGPFAASIVMNFVGPSAVFLFTAPVHVVLAGLALWRITRHARAPAAERTVFKEAPPASPALYQLDPGAPSETPPSQAIGN